MDQQQIGDYLVRRLIGEGGMGKVYEAEERLSKRRVALKVLHPDLGRREEGRRLFLNEMQILAHLEHPNIVRSLTTFEHEGELVMVLEYLEGQTLRDLLSAEERLPWTEAVRIVGSIASALATAHGQEPPVVHRDLKPENIMILRDGTVKVMDFGIAKVIAAVGQTNTQSVGTLQYMSPEQIDAHSIDHRSDLYCLGLIFYELLAGHPPFQSASPRQLLNLQCTAEPPPLPDEIRQGLPKGIETLIFQLLEKAPEDRPFLAEDIIERLEPFQTAAAPAPRTTSTTRSGLAQKTPRPTPKPRPTKNDENNDDENDDDDDDDENDDDAPKNNSRPKNARSAGERADTIALVERAEETRDVPAKVAIGIIVALSVLAGIGAYVLRATNSASDSPASSATAPVQESVPSRKNAL